MWGISACCANLETKILSGNSIYCDKKFRMSFIGIWRVSFFNVNKIICPIKIDGPNFLSLYWYKLRTIIYFLLKPALELFDVISACRKASNFFTADLWGELILSCSKWLFTSNALSSILNVYIKELWSDKLYSPWHSFGCPFSLCSSLSESDILKLISDLI